MITAELPVWFKRPLYLAMAIAAVYALIAGDLWLRAKEAYEQGEKYRRWHENPELKKQELEDEFAQERERLEALKSKGRINADDYKERLEILAFDKEEALRESSIKYAYIWYQTTVELFSPPESRWVKRSREKMLLAKEIWKKELQSNNIAFEDYMLE